MNKLITKVSLSTVRDIASPRAARAARAACRARRARRASPRNNRLNFISLKYQRKCIDKEFI